MTIAFIVRFYALGATPLSQDEAFTCRLIGYSIDQVLGRTANDVHPPLHYVVAKSWVSITGDSLPSLRSLSALFGILAIPLCYVLICEASPTTGSPAGGVRGRPCMKLAPLGACYMVAFHGVQVEAARAFRMYSQGVLLAATTAWLLLAALGARECRRRCWLAYGVAVGLFCYTHYYAFFTLLAQGLFVVGDLTLRWRKSGWAAVREPAKGLALASLIALAVFSPWIRVLSAQTSDVWHSYWIREVVWSQLAQSFAMWALGFRAYGASLWLALGAAGALIIFTLWRGGRAGFFFLIQALLPWALSLGISVFGSRPIFVDRYLVFASFAWICLWGVALANLRGLVRRVCLASFVLGCASYGLAQEMQTWPDRPPALANASTFLRNRYHRGDVVLVNSGPTVNLVRYYCGQAALRDMDVRCTDNVPHRGGHVVHVASLEASEFWVEPQRPDDLPPRIWIATLDGSAPRPPEAMRRILERSFEGGGHTKCALALYERAQ